MIEQFGSPYWFPAEVGAAIKAGPLDLADKIAYALEPKNFFDLKIKQAQAYPSTGSSTNIEEKILNYFLIELADISSIKFIQPQSLNFGVLNLSKLANFLKYLLFFEQINNFFYALIDIYFIGHQFKIRPQRFLIFLVNTCQKGNFFYF